MTPLDLVESSFKYNLLLMKILGLYPFDSWPGIYKIYAYLFHIIITAPAPILYFVNFVLKEHRDMSQISDSSFVIIDMGIIIVKFVSLKRYPERTKKTIFSLHKKSFNNYLDEQRHIVEDCANTSRKLFNFFVVCCTASFFAVKILMKDERIKEGKFPIEIWLPFDPMSNSLVYYTVMTLVVLAAVKAAYGNCVVDTLLAGLIYHGAGQLKILKDTLQNLHRRVDEQISNMGEKMNDEKREELKAKIIYKKICECVDHYDAVYEYVCDLEASFSLVVFSQMFVTIIVIALLCFQLSIVEPFTYSFFQMFIFLITLFIELYLYCYYGTVLTEESNTVTNAIYMSDWYNYNLKSKKALIILMERAKRPMKVTAGKLLDFSLDTFTMVLRRSYSFLAVLKNF